MKELAMTKLSLLAVFLFLRSELAFAGYEDESIWDTLHPWLNFVVLFGFIGYKLKPIISNGFTKNSEDIEGLYVVAEQKDKEAQIKLEMFTKKVHTLESSHEKILAQAKEDLKKFEKSYAEETDGNISRLKKDAVLRVQAEKEQMIQQLNTNILNEIITAAKKDIRADKSKQTKATEKLLQDL